MLCHLNLCAQLKVKTGDFKCSSGESNNNKTSAKLIPRYKFRFAIKLLSLSRVLKLVGYKRVTLIHSINQPENTLHGKIQRFSLCTSMRFKLDQNCCSGHKINN